MVDQKFAFACISAAAISALGLTILIKAARPLGLIDRPDHRKRHRGCVPLVGGLAVLTGVLSGVWMLEGIRRFDFALLSTSVLLVAVGAQDDRRNISVRTRLLVQTAAVLLMIGVTGVYIKNLGAPFGHVLQLGWLGVPFTVFAVLGLLNAFNLVDGIDGLAGLLALVSIGAILLLSEAGPGQGTAALLLLLACTLVPFLLSNVGLFGDRWKCFLGDSGSTLLGYLLAWSLIKFSETGTTHLTPATTLWCVAVPVMDTFAVMYRRLREGRSPFKPGSGHIHHLLMGAGLTSGAAVAVLVTLAATLALFGAWVREMQLGVGSNIAAFAFLTLVYIAVSTRMYSRQRSVVRPAARSQRLTSAKGDITV
ncbi:MAG TPA: undecaprenyl/decaprenyl-phosphate alpha-N-acetylglucosaminyl 1-phosphate transferase [Rhodanobacteraceae bacterium]|nr:undecaprenyl/decaprenyl-phosphate alpha-N-acetylglucosaminyl 1-phosphate transferase [Rhodanobacteraceae bacterium]